MMIGFGVGGIWMGRLADRRGVMWPLMVGAAGLALGFVAAGVSGGIISFSLAHGVLLGCSGASATFAPLVADTSLWFVRRRGIAVASAPAATTWPAPSGRRWCSTSSTAYGWRPPTSGWACSAR
jgi:MFS family permease